MAEPPHSPPATGTPAAAAAPDPVGAVAAQAPSPHPVAVVTGGSSGIGQAACVALAQAGYHVVVVGTSSARVEATRERIAADSNLSHLGLTLSVADPVQMETMAAATLAAFGRIDLLIASAGIGKSSGSTRVLPHPTAQLPLSEWQAIVDVNLTGMFLSNRAVLPTMITQGHGHIMNIGSSTTPQGLRGTPYAPGYCATKFAIVGLTEALAQEVEALGVRVQLVFPGPVETPLVSDTRLAKPFGGAVSAEHFAAALVGLARQPLDCVVVHPHLLPFAVRPRQ